MKKILGLILLVLFVVASTTVIVRDPYEVDAQAGADVRKRYTSEGTWVWQ